MIRLADGVVKISWNEPTGTCVSVAYNLNENIAHGATFASRGGSSWSRRRSSAFQNDKLALMQQYRDAGPTYRSCWSTSSPRSPSSRIAAATTRP